MSFSATASSPRLTSSRALTVTQSVEVQASEAPVHSPGGAAAGESQATNIDATSKVHAFIGETPERVVTGMIAVGDEAWKPAALSPAAAGG